MERKLAVLTGLTGLTGIPHLLSIGNIKYTLPVKVVKPVNRLFKLLK